MENNAITQRILQLSDLWSQEVKDHPEVRSFIMMGANLVEYKTIKGFVMFQASVEKTLPDTFLLHQRPFEGDGATYAAELLQNLHQYFQAFNQDASLVKEYGGKILWEYPYLGKSAVTQQEFISALTTLSATLKIDGKHSVLVIALFPEQVSDFDKLVEWVSLLTAIKIPSTIRLLLYDNTEARMYEELIKHNSTARYIKPDLDIPGAMNQILEETKAQKTSQEEIDIIQFQQYLIKLNEAATYTSEKDLLFYKEQCCNITSRYRWLQREAIVYFFVHNFYAYNNKEKAIESINKAIQLADEAMHKGLTDTNQEQFHYRIAKGNLYYFDKKLSEAASVYKSALALDAKDANPMMLAGLYQMLASCQRHTESHKATASSLLAGWELLSRLPEEELKENAMAMFYGRDMVELNDPELKKHESFMNRLWGNNWLQKIRNSQVYQGYTGAGEN
ncbi:hypothetical protein [Chitinophaga sp. Ak27]|uniref:hypothetical protein n=1 Tax=Chitinophaga sp. Ak27 TaxID=2726116 RepID=UPI00145DC224|nr:hypothetical protein [Chitinophaga sp. Ak27]NLU93144.1 hypothetical protein [Chitinophaga sp. Ak27]